MKLMYQVCASHYRYLAPCAHPCALVHPPHMHKTIPTITASATTEGVYIPCESDSPPILEKWIRDKYEHCKYKASKLPPQADLEKDKKKKKAKKSSKEAAPVAATASAPAPAPAPADDTFDLLGFHTAGSPASGSVPSNSGPAAHAAYDPFASPTSAPLPPPAASATAASAAPADDLFALWASPPAASPTTAAQSRAVSAPVTHHGHQHGLAAAWPPVSGGGRQPSRAGTAAAAPAANSAQKTAAIMALFDSPASGTPATALSAPSVAASGIVHSHSWAAAQSVQSTATVPGAGQGTPAPAWPGTGASAGNAGWPF